MELTDKSEAESFLKSENLTVTIEINGPALSKSDLQNGIESILNNTNINDKYNGIYSLINTSVGNLSDPEQGLITQYYFAPFTLKGVENINWDMRKESRLSTINENVLRIFTAKENVEKLTKTNSLNTILSEYDNIFNIELEFSKKEHYRNELSNVYNSILPNLKNYEIQLKSLYSQLEQIYNNCSDITCNSSSNCCDIETVTEKVDILIPKIENSIKELNNVFDNAFQSFLDELEVMFTPDCETNNWGTLTVENKSSNPYYIYSGGEYWFTIAGYGVETIEKFGLGRYNFKAVQKDGYAFYGLPT